MRSWQTEEIEELIVWVEENHERLRGRPVDWIRKAKEDIFPNNEHITAKKVRDKYTNMKKAWKEAKTMQEQSGFGLRGEDCESTENIESYSYLLIYRPGRRTRANALAPVFTATYFEVSLQAVLAWLIVLTSLM